MGSYTGEVMRVPLPPSLLVPLLLVAVPQNHVDVLPLVELFVSVPRPVSSVPKNKPKTKKKSI